MYPISEIALSLLAVLSLFHIFLNGDRVREQIRFCKLDKYVHIENFNYDTGVIFGKFLDIKELQAINKKCQELRLDMKQWKEIKGYELAIYNK